MAITRVFIYNGNQAVSLPSKLRFPDTVKKVEVHARGDVRIITPLGSRWNDFFLNAPLVSNDFMNEKDTET
jgi:antitoxin VapB